MAAVSPSRHFPADSRLPTRGTDFRTGIAAGRLPALSPLVNAQTRVAGSRRRRTHRFAAELSARPARRPPLAAATLCTIEAAIGTNQNSRKNRAQKQGVGGSSPPVGSLISEIVLPNASSVTSVVRTARVTPWSTGRDAEGARCVLPQGT